MFKQVSPKLNITQVEEAVLRMWKIRHIFAKSEEQRRGKPEYVFYEGPPTANGLPGVHHVLSPKSRSHMNQTGAVFGRNEIS